MNRHIFVPALALSMLAPVTLVGCGSTPLAETVSDSFWVPGAREVFTTIDADTLYAVVPDERNDVYIREEETGPDSRMTWIVRVPRDAPLDEPIALSDERVNGARAWLLEEVAGTPSAMLPAEGSIVLHARSADSARATVVLEAVTRSIVAGRLTPQTFSMTHRGSWSRDVRMPLAEVPKDTRSGVEPPADFDVNDPYRQESRVAR